MSSTFPRAVSFAMFVTVIPGGIYLSRNGKPAGPGVSGLVQHYESEIVVWRALSGTGSCAWPQEEVETQRPPFRRERRQTSFLSAYATLPRF